MKYRRLRITNYRGVDTAEIEFESQGVTLVQGPNEVGKTSLGQAIGLLFEYPDSSKHKAVIAVRPVHRDVGSEIELEAESGPYCFTYKKRFHKRPETALKITAPSPENLTGREAHDRALQILAETLDIDLWKALTIQQGEAIDQPDLANQQSLSAALDKAAGGVPTEQAEEGLFEKVTDEYGRFFTPTGKEKSNIGEARARGEQAESHVAEFEDKLRNLDQDTDNAARLQGELIDLREREAALTEELAAQSTSLREIEVLESQVSEANLKLGSAKKSLELATKARAERQDLIKLVETAEDEHRGIAESSKGWMSSLERAEKELAVAETAFKEMDQKRKHADTLVGLRRADFDYYNNLLFLAQLGERKERIDKARKNAAHAEETLSKNRVDEVALKSIESAERDLLGVSARLETAAPSVKLTGLDNCDLRIDNDDTAIKAEEVREFSVADRLRIVIPDKAEIEVVAGSSIDQLTRQLSQAQDTINSVCRDAGVGTPEAARSAFKARQEALRTIDEKDDVEQDNLRDLSYDELSEKLLRLEQTVPEYIAGRASDPPLAPDLGSARTEWENAVAAQNDCQSDWEAARETVDAARSLRDELSTETESARVNLRSLEKDLELQTNRLQAARKAVSDESIDLALKDAKNAFSSEEANVRTTEQSLTAKNPERIKTLAETATDSLATCKSRRESAQTELTQVQTRLKIHGEDGLYEKLQAAKTTLERVTSKNRSLFRQAAAAKLLYDTMRQERDLARQAYVAPLKDRVERLGRLVFEQDFQVELDESLQIVARTHNGITVPFDSLSGGTKEQLSLIFRLACSMIVAEEGGMPLIMDDALGYTDPERLRLMGAVLARAAKECQIVIFTCVPDRYANIGNAAIVSL
ncbi:MAG: AAA family ATPase [Fuerstiella sp.]